jgi:hypothetical protein
VILDERERFASIIAQFDSGLFTFLKKVSKIFFFLQMEKYVYSFFEIRLTFLAKTYIIDTE